MSGSTTSAAPAAQVQTANHFSLSGHGIHVDYSATSFTGQARLSYHDSTRTLSFVGDDIRVVDVPDIGSIVSVTLNITVDEGIPRCTRRRLRSRLSWGSARCIT